LNWRTYLKRITKKARRNMTKSFAMGIRTGHMSVEMSNNLWQTLVRPVVEYGSEIWGDCECKEIDKLQLEMGRRILKCHFTTAREVIRGELGWWPMKARRDEMRLRFWARLEHMEDDRIPSMIYRTSKDRLEQELENVKELTDSWCVYTRTLLEELDLLDFWTFGNLPDEDEWAEIIQDRIGEGAESVEDLSLCTS